MYTKSKLLIGLQRFETRIEVEASNASAALSAALQADPSVAYYLGRISASGRPGKIVFEVSYQNTDLPREDVHVVSSEAEIHSILCQSVGNYKDRIVMVAPRGLDAEAVYQRFWVVNAAFYSNLVSARISKMQMPSLPMTCFAFDFDYRIGKVKLRMMKIETDAAVKTIAKQLFVPGMTDEAKAFMAHNYLAYTIDYTMNQRDSDLEKSYTQSAYGALINKKCVCQGYAEAFKMLMDYAEIPCDIVCGQTKGSTTYHAWNIIKLNDETENYHIDVTWDSAGERVSYQYFGLRDADFEGERTWNREYNVRCNSPKNLRLEARRCIMRVKPQLIRNGVDVNMLGF